MKVKKRLCIHTYFYETASAKTHIIRTSLYIKKQKLFVKLHKPTEKHTQSLMGPVISEVNLQGKHHFIRLDTKIIVSLS